MRKKILTSLTLTFALSISTIFCGCGSKELITDGTTKDVVWERIEKSGTITLGSGGAYAPYTYYEDGKITGFDTELTFLVAEKLGLKVEFVQTKWDSLIAGLQSDRIDIVANQVGITEERKKSVNFSDPYCYIYPALAVKKGSDIASFNDLERRTCGLNLTTVFAPLAEKYGATLVSSDSGISNQVDMLLAGRIDSAINDQITFFNFLKTQPDANLEIVDIAKDSPTEIGFMVKKDSPVLTAKLNQALKELYEEGKIAELSEKFVGIDMTK